MKRIGLLTNPLMRGGRDYLRPAFFHNASTRATTPGDISMTLGQRRVKPSDFHLVVASTPILEP